MVGLETAFIATSRSSLRELVRHGDEQVKSLLSLREHPERTLSTLQLGMTFFAFFAAAIGGAGAEDHITPWLISNLNIPENLATILSLYVVVVPLIYANVVIGELVPKTLVMRNPLYFATVTAPWLYRACIIINPFAALFEWSTKKILHFFHKRRWIKEAITPQELLGIGDISPLNKQYILNIVKIETTTVKEIMLPLQEIVATNVNDVLEQVENVIISSGHTRLPVVKDDDVVGIINAKEFIAFQKTGQKSWQSLMRPALKIDGNIPLLTAFRAMQDKRVHMAIVYLGTKIAGIITIEDIFEEIVGDIYDEDDDGMIQKILSSNRAK